MKLKTAKNVITKWGRGEEIPLENNIKITLKGTTLKDIEALADIDGHLAKGEIDSINLSVVILDFVKNKLLKSRKAKKLGKATPKLLKKVDIWWIVKQKGKEKTQKYKIS